jgi:hypothetical protein
MPQGLDIHRFPYRDVGRPTITEPAQTTCDYNFRHLAAKNVAFRAGLFAMDFLHGDVAAESQGIEPRLH